MEKLIDKLRSEHRLEPEEYARLVAAASGETLDRAMRAAREVAVARFGTGIYIRGLIEVTNYCRNDCYYCGIRRNNRNVERYLLTREQQLDALKWQWLDEHTFFNYFSVERILSLVLKSQLLNRWKPLTQERGTAVFRDLLETLKKDIPLKGA